MIHEFGDPHLVWATGGAGFTGRTNPDGFEPCILDEDALQQLTGVETVHFSLPYIFERIRVADQAETDNILIDFSEKLDGLSELDQSALRNSLGTYQELRKISSEKELDGLDPKLFSA